MNQDRLLALPSKGRLKESAEEYLTQKLGLAIKGGSHRGYTADLWVGAQSYPVIYQQARDIALQIGLESKRKLWPPFGHDAGP